MKRPFYYDFLLFLLIFLSFAGFLRYTAAIRDAVGEALALSLRVLIPALFPSMVLSSLFIETGSAARLGRHLEGMMRVFFDLPGASAVPLLLGFTAGYPVGARSTLALYEADLLTSDEAERLLAFSNNAGPAFIFGAVGLSLFSSPKAGLILFLSHVSASFLVGFLSRFYRRGSRRSVPKKIAPASASSFSAAFTASVRSSAVSMLCITAFVVFFSAVIRLLSESGLLPRLSSAVSFFTGISPESADNLLIGMLEMTGGLSRFAAGNELLPAKLAAAAFLLGWAGLSVHCQALSFIGEKKLSLFPYFVGKLLQGTFSVLLTLLFFRLFPFSVPASSFPELSSHFLLSPIAVFLFSLLSIGFLRIFLPDTEKRL